MSRQLLLNSKSVKNGRCVVYVMSRDQRVHDNHALLYAQNAALKGNQPLVVVFNLLPGTGFRAREHFQFMLEGLKEVEKELSVLNIGFVLCAGSAKEQIKKTIDHLQPSEVVFDFNPLKGPRTMQKALSKKLNCKVSIVDAHNIIPLWVLSDKEEYAAHTIRSKVHRLLAKWLEPYPKLQKQPSKPPLDSAGISWDEAEKHISKFSKNGTKNKFKAGPTAANKELKNFIKLRLSSYASDRNNPTLEGQSNLSPYLHFGQLSAQRVALEIIKTTDQPPLLFRQAKLASFEGDPTHQDSVDSFLEELIVRKELADNYCFYNKDYRSLKGAKDWARESLTKHQADPREYVYSTSEWEQAKTHDQAWNAAQKQMVQTGKMHGYMRMYWAKKILEYSASPQEAIDTAIYLNDRYSLDGGDPNGYTGIMWSIAGVHDRPWFEREVFGKIRYMNEAGLKRKFKLNEYINKWQ